MAINLGGGFHIGSKQPIDDRLIMTKDEMLNVNENTFPDVYMCVCKDDGAIYTFNINNEANDETGKFRIIEGGNGVSVDCYTKTEIDTKLDDYTKSEELSTVATTGSYNDLLDKPTNYPAGSVEYVNDVVNSYTVEEALNKLIADFYYIESSITSFTASPAGGTYEVGTTISSPTFNWSYDKNIVSQTLTDCTLADETVRTATYAGDITTNKTLTLTASNGKNNVSSSISYSFVNPMYTAYINKDIDTTTITEDMITGGAKLLKKKNTFTFTTDKIVLDIEKFCFAYDSSYGVLSSIKDVNNGFECINAFDRIEMDITTADGTIVKYYVYLMKFGEILEDSDNFKYQIKW